MLSCNIVQKDINVIWPDNHKKNQAKRWLILNVTNAKRKENMKMVLMSVHNVIMLYMKNVLVILNFQKYTSFNLFLYNFSRNKFVISIFEILGIIIRKYDCSLKYGILNFFKQLQGFKIISHVLNKVINFVYFVNLKVFTKE